MFIPQTESTFIVADLASLEGLQAFFGGDLSEETYARAKSLTIIGIQLFH